jgi:hypothetical protein
MRVHHGLVPELEVSVKRDGAKAVGVGAALCVACCAGPIVGWLAAIGLFTVAGAAWFGAAAVVLGALAAAWVLRRRSRQAAACGAEAAAVPVELSSGPAAPFR